MVQIPRVPRVGVLRPLIETRGEPFAVDQPSQLAEGFRQKEHSEERSQGDEPRCFTIGCHSRRTKASVRPAAGWRCAASAGTYVEAPAETIHPPLGVTILQIE